MSAIPRQSGDVRGSERLRAQRDDEPEQLPFTDPLEDDDCCPDCLGEGVTYETCTRSYGNIELIDYRTVPCITCGGRGD